MKGKKRLSRRNLCPVDCQSVDDRVEVVGGTFQTIVDNRFNSVISDGRKIYYNE